MANKTIPFRIFIKDTATDDTRLWGELTEEEKEGYKKRMSKNLGQRMSDYYSAHPDEYERL
jgi:hypothetical protein